MVEVTPARLDFFTRVPEHREHPNREFDPSTASMQAKLLCTSIPAAQEQTLDRQPLHITPVSVLAACVYIHTNIHLNLGMEM